MEDFRLYHLPSVPDPTQSRAAWERARYAMAFVTYMADREQPPEAHLIYLACRARFTAWFTKLHAALAPTTVANYILACVRFVKFLRAARPHGMRLTQEQMETILRRLENERDSMTTELAEHRHKVLDSKSDRVLSAADLRKFTTTARKKIPLALDVLRGDPGWGHAVNRCVGLLVAYLTTLSGLRKGCFMFMSSTDVREARLAAGAEDGARVLFLGRHKTQRVYGPAKMLLSQREHGWLLTFDRLRRHMSGYSDEVETFFFNSRGKPLDKMTSHVRGAYLNICHRAGVTPTAIRTAVATLSSQRLTLEQQSILGRGMGHSLRTRDRFYVALEDGNELRHKRALFEKAMEPESQHERLSEPEQRSEPDDDAYVNHAVNRALSRRTAERNHHHHHHQHTDETPGPSRGAPPRRRRRTNTDEKPGRSRAAPRRRRRTNTDEKPGRSRAAPRRRRTQTPTATTDQPKRRSARRAVLRR